MTSVVSRILPGAEEVGQVVGILKGQADLDDACDLGGKARPDVKHGPAGGVFADAIASGHGRTLARPRLLDLFCCQGGAGAGYSAAGFEVVGVDLDPQPRYPFAFIQHDALTLDPRFLRSFDAIHASPPCQGYSAMRHAPGAVGAPLLIEQVRAMLEATGLPYTIENVEEARWAMRDPILLCGSMFDLGAQGCRLQRHRLFESNVAITPPAACHHDDRPVIGIYGGHARRRAASAGGRGTRDVWDGGDRAAAVEAMEMPWATLGGMSEAVPPIFTQCLGEQLAAILHQKEAA